MNFSNHIFLSNVSCDWPWLWSSESLFIVLQWSHISEIINEILNRRNKRLIVLRVMCNILLQFDCLVPESGPYNSNILSWKSMLTEGCQLDDKRECYQCWTGPGEVMFVFWPRQRNCDSGGWRWASDHHWRFRTGQDRTSLSTLNTLHSTLNSLLLLWDQ